MDNEPEIPRDVPFLTKAGFFFGPSYEGYMPFGVDAQQVANLLAQRTAPWYRDPIPGWVVIVMAVPLALAMLVVLVCLTRGGM